MTTCKTCSLPMVLIEDGQTTHPNCDPPSGNIEPATNAVRTAWPNAKITSQWLAENELFPGSGQCKDCGDPLNGPSLMQRCGSRHQAVRT